MTLTPTADYRPKSALRTVLGMLWRDKFATAAVIFLLVAILCAHPRPGAARRGGHQAEPARSQRPAVQPRAGLADDPRRRRPRPAAARPDHRRGAEHADDRRRRRRALRHHRRRARARRRLRAEVARHRDHAAGRRDHVVPVAAAGGDRALHAVALGRERDPRARDHPHPDLPAHHPRRGAGDQGADVRPGGAGDGRLVDCASCSATSCRW